MTLRNAPTLPFLLTVLLIAVFASTDAFAQSGKKKGGGGGGGSAAPVQYQVVQIPYSKGREINAQDLNLHGEACGYVGLSPGPFEAVYYDGAGTTSTLNDLVDLIDPQARDGWNIAYSDSINDAGQITGGAKRDGQTAAFIVDPYDIANPIVLLPSSPLIENSNGAVINNAGDVLVRATGGITLLYSSDTQHYTFLGEGSAEGLSNRDANGLVVAAISHGESSTRFLVGGDTIIQSESISGFNARAVNDFGTLTGSSQGKRNASYAARYDTDLYVFKDGRKDLSGYGVDINNAGDIGINNETLFTPEHGTLPLRDLIQPSDRTFFTEGFYMIVIDAVTERDASGFPMILTTNYVSSSSAASDESFILVPVSSD